MWYRVGGPPETLIAWSVRLLVRGGRTSLEDGWTVSYPAYIYGVHVDWWIDEWPQLTCPFSADPASPRLPVLGAHVEAAAGFKATWRFRWWSTNPTRPVVCDLVPPEAELTDQETVPLNRARGAFIRRTAWGQIRYQACLARR
jgi:hypothetical protein